MDLNIWTDVSASLAMHLLLTLTSPSGGGNAPWVTIEMSEDGASIAEQWEYLPPDVEQEIYLPRYLLTHDFVRIGVVGGVGWQIAAEIVEPVANPDGRPAILNPPLTEMGEQFDALAYAGAHGGPVVTGNGEPPYRYRFSDVRARTLVDWNTTTARVDIHEDGMRAHSSANLYFLLDTPTGWDRGAGTIHFVVRHHENEEGPFGISRHARFAGNNNYRIWRDPANDKWGLEIGNKQRSWTGLPSIYGYDQVSTLTFAWDANAWDAWVNGQKFSKAGWNISGTDMPEGAIEFLSNGQVVRLVAIVFAVSRTKLPDIAIETLHADPYAWAE